MPLAEVPAGTSQGPLIHVFRCAQRHANVRVHKCPGPPNLERSLSWAICCVLVFSAGPVLGQLGPGEQLGSM